MTSGRRLESFVFEPPLPGSWARGDQRAFESTNEEAAHAVMCALLCVPILDVRVDHPDPYVSGLVRTVPDPDRLYQHLLVTLAGPLIVRRAIPWPPAIAAVGDLDQVVCARLVPRLGLDEAQFNKAKDMARRLLDLPFSRRATLAVSRALLDRGALTGPEVHAVIAESREW
jgi:hypothetical protein